MTDPRSASGPTRPASWYDEQPQARWSFSRFATFERCPGWFRYQYLEWHRTPSTPVLRAGHAVQRALERVFDGKPGAEVPLEDLEQRARTRLDRVFDEEWGAAAAAHEADPNGLGPWDLPEDRYRRYAHNGLAWHVDEVRARLERRHPRTGAALDLPETTVVGAWEAVRPWHAPDTDDFEEAMERVPEGFFQGQYDIVYDWTGGRRIVDFKASAGSSAFSGEIVLQLTFYAWMERELGRGRPEGLEAWFLGQDGPKTYPVPEESELDAIRARLLAAIDRAGSERGFDGWDPADFRPDPQVLETHAARDGAASAWCAYCPAAASCEKSGLEGVAPGDGLDPSQPERTAKVMEGVVAGIAEPRERSNGKTTQRFTLIHRGGAQSFTWNAQVVGRLIEQGLKIGEHVRLEGLRPWKHPASGAVLYYDSPSTRIAPPGAAQADALF